MTAKINLGVHSVITDVNLTEQLSEELIQFPEFLATIIRDGNDYKLVEAIDKYGHDITMELAPYSITIKQL